MKQFDDLLSVAKTLLGPKGCPWDRKQTLHSLQAYLLEETHELIEAIDHQDVDKMREELGDAFYTVLFVAQVAEKQKLFQLSEVMDQVREKLIRRHPHIFSDVKADSAEEVMKNWEEVKKQEGRKSPFEGIPPTLPSLARVQKVISKLHRVYGLEKRKSSLVSEEQLSEKLWHLVEEAEAMGFDAESALRRFCQEKESSLKSPSS
jgi:MazG family protein